MEGFTKMISSLGFTPAAFWAYVAAYTEVIGGVFLLFGVFTRISAALLFILIMVAGMTVHASKGFFLSAGGFEYTFIIACACAALALLGSGELSVTKRL